MSHKGNILNSKSEWHQPKIIQTTILQGEAETRHQGNGSSNVNYVRNIPELRIHSQAKPSAHLHHLLSHI